MNTVTYPGDVWSFTTQEYAAVDDFESYNDQDHCIFDTWIDGYTNGLSGSIVGYMQAPFAERTVVHGGKQSMPFEYNNVKSPYYSEAARTFDTPQNWTTNGADTLALYFRSQAVSLVDNGNNAYTMSASGTDIWNNGDQFRFAYKQLNGNGSITVTRGCYRQHQRLGQGRSHDSRNPGRRVQERVHRGDAGQWCVLPMARHRQRRVRQQWYGWTGGAVLVAAHSHGQRLQGGVLGGWQDLDCRRARTRPLRWRPRSTSVWR